MKIGLALGSGASRGWAHIGVIQALEELGIEIDIVTGCSIGSYVGAAYASGKLAPLAEWVKSLTEWQVFALMGVGFYRGGLVSGLKVFKALEDNFAFDTFDKLHKPFAAVATDLYSGREVDFTQGSVIQAVRASCAIPGLFPPVCIDNRWLVDGGVVNPVPVNLCRLLGADIVFAINLSADFRPQSLLQNQHEHEKNQQKTSDFFKRSQAQIQNWFKKGSKPDAEGSEFLGEEQQQDLKVEGEIDILEQANAEVPSDQSNPTSSALPTPSILNAMSGSLDILQGRVTRSRLAGDPPDILIEPQLRDFGMMEFYRAEELIEEGRNSVKRIADQIKYQLRLSN
ncbi:MAG: patatin-like phospholipase family protein [Paraglaciecola sp.]|nr:patatin-like phospholipase family protein [Paraglaciecola sp.]